MKKVTKKSWKEFRNTGLLLIINQILHIFGWAIVVITDEFDNIKDVYPIRTKCRGFTSGEISDAYKKVSEYMFDNSHELFKEAHQ